MARVRIDWNTAELDRVLRSETGPTGRLMHRAGRVVKAGAQRRCPVSPDGSGDNLPGHLRDSIDSTVGRDADGLHADIGTDVSYALPVELGSRSHDIESHGDYPLRAKDGRVFGKVVHHPGTEAQPFLRPALDDLREL